MYSGMCRSNIDMVILKPPSRCLMPNRVASDWVAIDACIADTVTLLWLFGYATLTSCCGHGRGPGEIMVGGRLLDGRTWAVLPEVKP